MTIIKFVLLAMVISLVKSSEESNQPFRMAHRSSASRDQTYFYANGTHYMTYTELWNPVDRRPSISIVKVVNRRDPLRPGALIVNVFDSDGLIDCNVIENKTEVQRFIDEVSEEIRTGGEEVESGPTPLYLDATLSVWRQGERCRDLLQARASEQTDRSSGSALQPVDIVGHFDGYETVDAVEQQHDRQKRAYLIWPGTNWCGKGSKAEFAESYGENVETDKCCQKHDQCPYIIEGFQTKYNLFNYRMHTLSICECDEKFMDCLNSANTSTSTMVGKVFFNVVNTECFDLKLQKTCAKRSWWGGCEKYATKWTATIRTLGDFPVTKK